MHNSIVIAQINVLLVSEEYTSGENYYYYYLITFYLGYNVVVDIIEELKALKCCLTTLSEVFVIIFHLPKTPTWSRESEQTGT